MAVAPQPKATPLTVNETLRDRAIAHGVFLERLKANEGQKILAHLRDDVLPDLVAKLESRLKTIGQRGIDSDTAGTNRLAEIVEFVQETIDAWTSGLTADLAARVDEIGQQEAQWQHDLFQGVIPIQWDTVMPSAGTVSAMIAQSPIDGVLLADIVDRLGGSTKNALEKAIRIGVTEGEAIPTIIARIRKVTDFTAGTAEAVARTAVQHASSAARQATVNENLDLVKGVLWVATLDTRTCPRCMVLDGKLFDTNAGPRPPRHIMCRCTPVPVLRSLRELGFDVNDYAPAMRASMNGAVPASETYGTWLKRQAPSIQDEALGPTRASLYRSGKINISDFVDRGGDPYDLDELRQREAAAFAAAHL